MKQLKLCLLLSLLIIASHLHAQDTDDEIIEDGSEENSNSHTTWEYSSVNPISHLTRWGKIDEGDEIDMKRLSEIHVTSHDLKLHFGGRLKDEFFYYHQVHTLRSDYHDENDFFRHKLNLDFLMTQGVNTCGKPSSQAGVRLTNYVFWQDESNYLPLTIDEIKIPELDNLTIAKDVKVKTLIPLIFVEQAWFKINFETFTDTFKNLPAFVRIGYFPYTVGRGISMGVHEDLAVDYLGWAGEGGFTRYPFMPPGILFRAQWNDHLSWDVYFNLWRETNASLIDTLKPDRSSRLFGHRPERGSGKDRIMLATKFDYERDYPGFGNLLFEPYFLYVNAPELQIELPADSSSRLYTFGMMADWHYNNFSVNIELAGQFGHQKVHAIDRNIELLTRSSINGNVQTSFSHIDLINTMAPQTNPAQRAQAPVSQDQAGSTNTLVDVFEPQNDYHFLVNAPNNQDLHQQSKTILRTNGQPSIPQGLANTNLINSDVFGNKRFRNPYKLSNQGVMALLDISYECEKNPFKFAGSLGHISGDNYPYNEEVDQTYHGFIPLRSRYRGLANQNFLIFDRLVLPRPLNIAYNKLYAFNNLKDLSNLQFIGLGSTWYPCKERNKLAITTDIMFLWEAATLRKWDKNGKHPDPEIEKQLVRLRNTPVDNPIPQVPVGAPTLFSGWETQEHARRMLGTEVDIKFLYRMLDHCSWSTKCVLFFPGGLYKDLDGQPNIITQRVDEQNIVHFDSLGHQVAFAFVTGLHYRF